MRFLADTTITVTNGQMIAIAVGIAVVFGLQVWALIETATRRRWGWLAAIWVTFPLGTLAWLTYARWRPDVAVR
ncbi:MAG TPA: hypothetical protein VFJ17_00645 [Mycobacteriales bacterium]|nr:hypothetical protein [Mycobacteriales bacterium]